MSSTTEALTTLHQQLERLRPAVDHIEAAKSVTDAAGKLPEQHKELLLNYLKEQQAYFDKLGNDFKDKIEKVSESVDGLNQQTQKLAEKIMEDHRLSAKVVEDSSNNIVSSYSAQAEKITETLRDGSSRLNSELKEQSEKVKDSIVRKINELSEVEERIRAYQAFIEKVDFPTRLDKLDATVSGIMAATQTTQGRVDNLERSMLEKIGLLSAQNEKTKKEFVEKVEITQKSLRSWMIISIVLGVLSFVAITYLIISS